MPATRDDDAGRRLATARVRRVGVVSAQRDEERLLRLELAEQLRERRAAEARVVVLLLDLVAQVVQVAQPAEVEQLGQKLCKASKLTFPAPKKEVFINYSMLALLPLERAGEGCTRVRCPHPRCCSFARGSSARVL